MVLGYHNYMHVTSWKQDCYVGIIIMMGKRIVCIISVLVFAAFGLWASFATRPSVSAWFGAVFCHPTADYLKEYPGDPSAETPPFRTSQSFGFDLDVLNVAFVFNEKNSAIQLGVGLTYLNVSESLPYGLSILKPYYGVGFIADANWRMNNRLDLGFRYRFLTCRFSGTETRFLVQEFELVPAFRFASIKAVDFFVSMPVTASWKADSISIRTSVALTFSLDSLKVVGR